ncbi:hypothetical protein HOY82DRAFT_217514 [Tuber indicum]|nr:hypothetical protein HOY82DRAFT_217514 [Tuber indicum]
MIGYTAPCILMLLTVVYSMSLRGNQDTGSKKGSCEPNASWHAMRSKLTRQRDARCSSRCRKSTLQSLSREEAWWCWLYTFWVYCLKTPPANIPRNRKAGSRTLLFNSAHPPPSPSLRCCRS